MGLVTKQTLNQSGRKVTRVEVPEWEGEIILRALSAAQAIEFAAYYNAQGDKPGANLRVAAWLLTAAWVDESGAPVLSLGDIDLLLETQTVELLIALGQQVTDLSGTQRDAIASAEKNSQSNQS